MSTCKTYPTSTENQNSDSGIECLRRKSLRKYNRVVGEHSFGDAMFDAAKQFRDAKRIVIATPFWNIADVQYYKTEGLDIQGVDVSDTLQQTMNGSMNEIT
jgi:hypothetical protein